MADRVKHWITFNEPYVHAVYGYARGDHAPGRTSDPTREPYIAVHYMLLAHGYAVARYRREYHATQRGIISLSVNSDWREPLGSTPSDLAASQRSMEFNLGWIAGDGCPLTYAALSPVPCILPPAPCPLSPISYLLPPTFPQTPTHLIPPFQSYLVSL